MTTLNKLLDSMSDIISTKLDCHTGNATTRPFLHDNDIMSMYAHLSTVYTPAQIDWWLRDYTDIESDHRTEIFEALGDTLVVVEPVAIAGCSDSNTPFIADELEWLRENTTTAIRIENYPMEDHNCFVFYDWEEAIAFKLRWVNT